MEISFFMCLFSDLVIISYNFDCMKLYKSSSNFYKYFTAMYIDSPTYIYIYIDIMKFYSIEITLASMRKLHILQEALATWSVAKRFRSMKPDYLYTEQLLLSFRRILYICVCI